MWPGDVVAGAFEVEQFVGRGGMGSVYRARDLKTGAPVAIKVQVGPREAQSRRWAREAMLLEKLSGPDIVRYLAHGKTPTGELYLVMEWLEGEDLATRLDREGLSVSESLGVAARVATALGRVHAQGIAHRDIKPSNIFLVDGDAARIKVIDFGIARVGGGVTGSSTLLGTPGYVAPEQARGDALVDARADVFALGCVLFECVTGRPAFVADHDDVGLNEPKPSRGRERSVPLEQQEEPRRAALLRTDGAAVLQRKGSVGRSHERRS